MSATVIYGTDFKRSNPKADRAFWIGPDPLTVMAAEILKDDAFRFADAAPCELCGQDCGDCA